MLEELFALTYLLPGIALPYDSLDAADRKWLLERVTKQKREEAAAIKRGRK